MGTSGWSPRGERGWISTGTTGPGWREQQPQGNTNLLEVHSLCPRAVLGVGNILPQQLLHPGMSGKTWAWCCSCSAILFIHSAVAMEMINGHEIIIGEVIKSPQMAQI